LVLGGDPGRILDRHLIPSEGDDLRAKGAMYLIEGRTLERAQSRGVGHAPCSTPEDMTDKYAGLTGLILVAPVTRTVTARRGNVSEYRRTLFDKYGPAAVDRIRAFSYGAMVFGLTLAALALSMHRFSLLTL